MPELALAVTTVIALARGELGYHESPAGSNRTKYGLWYGMNGSPWCAMFVSWLFAKLDALALIHGKYARTDAKAAALRRAGLLHIGASGIRAGDVVFYAFNGAHFQGRYLGIEHTGICVKGRLSATDSRIGAIEGNTSAGSDANGGAVQLRFRNRMFIAAYFRPKYTEPLKYAKRIGPGCKDRVRVTWVQTRLIAHGHRLTTHGANGDFNKETAAAVRAFRIAGKMTPGITVGLHVWDALAARP